jgi:hypothetical protein
MHLCMLSATSIHSDLAKRLLKFYPKLIVDIYIDEEYYGLYQFDYCLLSAKRSITILSHLNQARTYFTSQSLTKTLPWSNIYWTTESITRIVAVVISWVQKIRKPVATTVSLQKSFWTTQLLITTGKWLRRWRTMETKCSSWPRIQIL